MAAKLLLLTSFLYTLAITILSLVKLGKISVGSFNPTDKMLHAGAYLVLGGLWMLYYYFKQEEKVFFYKSLIIISIACVAFGILIEVLQGALTTYREPDWLDALANATGVLIAFIVFLASRKLLIVLKQKINLLF